MYVETQYVEARDRCRFVLDAGLAPIAFEIEGDLIQTDVRLHPLAQSLTSLNAAVLGDDDKD